MRIAIISRYLPSDSKMGVGYQVHYMANEMVGRGHEVVVFSLSGRPEDARYAVEQVKVKPPMRSLRMSWQLRGVEWGRFDILHAHGDDWFLWGREVPGHVRTVHGACLEELRHISGLRNKGYMLWLAGLERLSGMVADRVVGVSENTCRSYSWVKMMIPNGVDLGEFRPGEGKEAVPTILFVGTYENRKRGKLLMEIFAKEIRPAVPGAKLWMVCSEAPVAEGVEVLGRLSTRELAERYRRAWVFCLPSTYEGFGVPYIEAMASGTAVVATENVGAREVLGDSEHGVIAAEGSLGDRLIGLLRDERLREHFEMKGIQRAAQFGWERIAGRYESLYREVIEGRRDAAAGLRTSRKAAV